MELVNKSFSKRCKVYSGLPKKKLWFTGENEGGSVDNGSPILGTLRTAKMHKVTKRPNIFVAVFEILNYLIVIYVIFSLQNLQIMAHVVGGTCDFLSGFFFSIMRVLAKPILKKKLNARFNHGGLNFELSTEQLAFQEMAREFARKKILPAAAALDL